jgi:hypothetical protein
MGCLIALKRLSQQCTSAPLCSQAGLVVTLVAVVDLEIPTFSAHGDKGLFRFKN